MKKMKVRGPATLEERVLSGLYLFFLFFFFPLTLNVPPGRNPTKKGQNGRRKRCVKEKEESEETRYVCATVVGNCRDGRTCTRIFFFFPILLGSLVYYTLRTHLFACFRRRDRRTHEAAKPLIIFPFRSEGGN